MTTTFTRFMLLATASLLGFGCQHDKEQVLPTDAALLGRWNQVPLYAAAPASRARLSLEFASDGQLRHYRNDTLTREDSYQHRAVPRNIEPAPGARYLQQDISGARMYRIEHDTLEMFTPSYKGLMNCFPVYEKYVRAHNSGVPAATKPN